MSKLMLRKVKWLAEGHTKSPPQSQLESFKEKKGTEQNKCTVCPKCRNSSYFQIQTENLLDLKE